MACSLTCLRSDRTLNLVGTQASCADIYMARSTVNDCLDTFDVGLPCTVRTSVRMGDLDTECYALAADIAFCHRMHLLAAWKINVGRYKAPTNILADCVGNCKNFFRKNPKRKSQAKNAVLFQQTILRYFVHFGQHEKATRQSPAGSLCFIVLFPCYFRVLCVRFSLKYERTGAARPPPPSTRPAPCSHSARLKPSLGSCSSRFGFA